MSLLAAMVGTLAPAKITVDSNWGSSSGAHGNFVDSNIQNLTIPTGNPGRMNLAISTYAGGPTMKYGINGDINPGTFTNNTVITQPVNCSLYFEAANDSSSAGTVIVTVTDRATSATIGTWTLTLS